MVSVIVLKGNKPFLVLKSNKIDLLLLSPKASFDAMQAPPTWRETEKAVHPSTRCDLNPEVLQNKSWKKPPQTRCYIDFLVVKIAEVRPRNIYVFRNK
jgi:hypothetical protein